MDAPSTAHEASSSSSPSSSSTGHWEYDVFLSFRGIDTRYTFADHLYEALKAFEVKVYNDNYDLRRGENIADELKQAIERARICVIVFSNRYADSRWCLDELEKIMESRRTRGGKTVLPIFYYVDPTDVRNQTGSFAEAFHTHELRFNGDGDKVQSWRSACTEAADLAGAHLKTDW